MKKFKEEITLVLNEGILPEAKDKLGALCLKNEFYNSHFLRNVLSSKQFNYFTFTDIGEYKVTSSKSFFVGKPVNLKPTIKQVQAVITIFVDGLANSAIEERLHNLM